jgi:hypothetical protein
MGSFENVTAFYWPNVVIEEFPNRMAPQGRVRRADDLRARMNREDKSFGRRLTECSKFLKPVMRWPSSWSGVQSSLFQL